MTFYSVTDYLSSFSYPRYFNGTRISLFFFAYVFLTYLLNVFLLLIYCFLMYVYLFINSFVILGICDDTVLAVFFVFFKSDYYYLFIF